MCEVDKFLGAFAEIAKSNYWRRRICSSVRPLWTTRPPLEGFSWNLVSECFSIPCRADSYFIIPLYAELNPICHLLALLGPHHILHISRIRVKNVPRITVYFTRRPTYIFVHMSLSSSFNEKCHIQKLYRQYKQVLCSTCSQKSCCL